MATTTATNINNSHLTAANTANPNYNSVEKGGVIDHHNAPLQRGVTPGGNPYEPLQPGFPVNHRRFANPAPLGLIAFATTTLVLSLFNAHARHITVPNMVVGLAFGYGGLAQLLAGMWEFACGNTFGATAFSSYGAFWISFGLIFWPSSGILAAYSSNEGELASALGIYLLSWMIVTFLFLIASMRSSIALASVFFWLTLTFMLLAIGALKPSVNSTKAGGWLGIITALNAYYVSLSGLLTPTTSHFLLPIGPLGPKI